MLFTASIVECSLHSHSNYTDTTFTTEDCNKQKKIGDNLKRHAKSEVHKDSMAMWRAYKQTKSFPTVADHLISQRASTITSNRAHISKVAVYVLIKAFL